MSAMKEDHGSFVQPVYVYTTVSPCIHTVVYTVWLVSTGSEVSPCHEYCMLNCGPENEAKTTAE